MMIDWARTCMTFCARHVQTFRSWLLFGSVAGGQQKTQNTGNVATDWNKLRNQWGILILQERASGFLISCRAFFRYRRHHADCGINIRHLTIYAFAVANSDKSAPRDHRETHMRLSLPALLAAASFLLWFEDAVPPVPFLLWRDLLDSHKAC